MKSNALWFLLQELSDPFAILPLQDVARSLTDSATESEEAFREREGPYGVSRKYWDVPMEMLDEGIGVAIGSAFVLGQAAIAQSTSIVAKIRKLSDSHSAIPKSKRELLEMEASISLNTNLSNIVIIDTAANYFKHHHEWPDKWHEEINGAGIQAKTMADAKRLGMVGHELPSNMQTALHALDLDTCEVFTVPMIVHDWREKLAARFSRDLGVQLG